MACPSQSKLFLSFRSVNSDVVYTVIKHCLTGSLFACLINRTNLRFSSSNMSWASYAITRNTYCRGLISKFCCVPMTRIFVFLEMEHFLKFPQSILTANLVHVAFFTQLDVIKASSKPHCSLSPGRIFEWPQFPKLRLLRCPKFLRIFSPSFRWVLPVAWPRAAAPEV